MSLDTSSSKWQSDSTSIGNHTYESILRVWLGNAYKSSYVTSDIPYNRRNMTTFSKWEDHDVSWTASKLNNLTWTSGERRKEYERNCKSEGKSKGKRKPGCDKEGLWRNGKSWQNSRP